MTAINICYNDKISLMQYARTRKQQAYYLYAHALSIIVQVMYDHFIGFEKFLF